MQSFLHIFIEVYIRICFVYYIDDLAVDWVSNKLYWVDAAWARIEVLDLESLYRAEVLRVGANTNPRAIAVEPHMRSVHMQYMKACSHIYLYLYCAHKVHVLD